MRGSPIKQDIIGHTVYGDLNGTRYKWTFSLKDKTKAESAGANLGMTNIKAYAIYSDNPLPMRNNESAPQEG
jgi:hypothetical protein